MNKKGGFTGIAKIVLWVGGIYLLLSVLSFLILGYGLAEFVEKEVETKISDAVRNTESFGVVFASQFAFFDFIFGQIPSYLINFTNNTSAAIIIIGIWFLLLLTFGDVMSIFGTFSKTASWAIAIVLVIVAANIKIITWIAVVGLVLAAGLGAAAVFVNIIGIFIIFILFNYGSDEIREWVIERKRKEMGIRAAMGSGKAKAGLQTLAEIGETSYKIGKRP